jgi:hypothetical protein
MPRERSCLGYPILTDPDLMPNTPPGSRPDPMMREVNRLLAQLEHTAPRLQAATPERASEAPPSRQLPTKSGEVAPSPPKRGRVAALWSGVFLAVALGVMMTQWPYPKDCGLPLLSYFGAVAAVLFAGAGIAFDSWRLRIGVAHILSLMLMFWAMVLAAEQVLPRVGYAADQASWRCVSDPSPRSSSTDRSVGPPR